jgi:dolichol-phosphate mannosyltransferase
MPNSHSLSVIIPALNESKIIGNYIDEIYPIISNRFQDFEIILINDGSTDDTNLVMEMASLKFPNIKVFHNEINIGFGGSYAKGVSFCSKEYVMLLCGDGALPGKCLPLIIEKIGAADIVIPWVENLRNAKSPFRYFLSRSYTNLLNLLFGLNLHYYNGTPVHKLSNLKKIKITSSGFGFQAEILIKLLKSGNSYVEVGIFTVEEKNSSHAMKLQNWVSVGKTILRLFFIRNH